MNGLSTNHVVLGLLIEQKGYGYDLLKRARSRFGYLGLSENFVYKALGRLERDGWIEETGDKAVGNTRRGAPRVIYRSTPLGRKRFKEWMATPSERAILRDELQAKLSLSKPDDLPELLSLAEAQAGECIAELATLQRPVLAHVAEPAVPWNHAAVMMVDDLDARWLQALVDWLNAICELIEERIERTDASSGPS